MELRISHAYRDEHATLLAFLLQLHLDYGRRVCANTRCPRYCTAVHQGGLWRCGGCAVARYCDRRCQRADWARHRPYCNEVREFFNTVATVE